MGLSKVKQLKHFPFPTLQLEVVLQKLYIYGMYTHK